MSTIIRNRIVGLTATGLGLCVVASHAAHADHATTAKTTTTTAPAKKATVTNVPQRGVAPNAPQGMTPAAANHVLPPIPSAGQVRPGVPNNYGRTPALPAPRTFNTPNTMPVRGTIPVPGARPDIRNVPGSMAHPVYRTPAQSMTELRSRWYQSPADQQQFAAAHQIAMQRGYSNTTWVGADGLNRSVVMTVSRPVPMTNIVFLPVAGVAVGGAAVGAAYAGGAGGPPATAVNYTLPDDRSAAGNIDPGTQSPISGDATVSQGGATYADAGDTGTNGAAMPPDASTPAPLPAQPTPPAAAALNNVVPQTICRNLRTQSTVGNQSDDVTGLECRDPATGDWAPARKASDGPQTMQGL